MRRMDKPIIGAINGVAIGGGMCLSLGTDIRIAAAVELESHTQLFVRPTTKNFEEASRARKEGRKAKFED